MSESRPELEGWTRAASDRAPEYGWFAGVLDGRVGDATLLRAAAQRVEALGLVGTDLEVDGGRFSFMFEEARVAGARLTVGGQDALVEALQGLVDAAAPARAVESTLRCSLVFEDHVVETLFAPLDGQLRPVSRKRPLEARDREHATALGDEAGAGRMDRRRGLVVLLLVLVGGGLFAWQRGYVARVRDALSTRASEDLQRELGPFRAALALEVESRFGRYECAVRRGATYPTHAADVDAWVAASITTEERAAANAVGDGATIWLRLVDEGGVTLEATRVDLRPLLSDPDGRCRVELRARLKGARVELALDAGRTREELARDQSMRSERGEHRGRD